MGTHIFCHLQFVIKMSTTIMFWRQWFWQQQLSTTQRASPKHNNVFAKLQVGQLTGVHADRQWLDHSAQLQRNVVWEFEQEISWSFVVFAQSTWWVRFVGVDWWRSSKCHVDTSGSFLTCTRRCILTGHLVQWRPCRPLSSWLRRHQRQQPHRPTRGPTPLVFSNKRPDQAMGIVMDI